MNIKDLMEPTDICGRIDNVLDLARMKEHFKTHHEIPHDCHLFINEDEHGAVDYCLARFHSSDMDMNETKLSHVFSGHGYSSLREMRHTYWGEDMDGYTFYLPGHAVIAALQILSKYFDMN